MLSRCASLAAWSTAALRQEVGVEQAIDALHAGQCEPIIATAGGSDESAVASRFALSIGRWRSLGIQGWRYVPVAPADSHGVPGPPEFHRQALDAGAALVSVDGPPLGLVPAPVDATPKVQESRLFPLVELPTSDQGARPVESVSDLDRALLTALTEVTDMMEGLELARWRDDIHDLLEQWGEPPHMPPGTPGRAQRLAARSERVLALIELASDDEGGSRTASEMAQRASALRDLGRVARAAHAAAWNTGLVDASSRR
jgi:hypothetical protein